MPQPGSESLEARDLRVERALLSEILFLHPDHLTSEELVLKMEDGQSDTGGVAILDALQALKRSGLVRLNGEVLEPTYAALRAAAIFECFPLTY
jgi:hypothetical protein